MSGSESTHPSWRVVVFGQPDQIPDLAEVLSSELGLVAIDAMQHAHSAPGVLPHSMDRTTAERVAGAIARSGLSAKAIPDAELPQLHEAPRLHHVRCEDNGLVLIGLHGEVTERIPWASFQLLCIGQVPEDSVRRYDATDTHLLAAAPDPLIRSHAYPVSEGPEAWLFAAPDRVFRIDHLQMNYEYLGERMESSAAVNFRLLIDDLLTRTVHLRRSPSTRAWLELHWLMMRAAMTTPATESEIRYDSPRDSAGTAVPETGIG